MNTATLKKFGLIALVAVAAVKLAQVASNKLSASSNATAQKAANLLPN